ncbi:HU family DNA-binding protein [Desulfobacca acetoxidans]|uniref:Histone family protein DNA-binding protein n=1 Tax=Desulfobacca acetoxidans (strain ATCC 700848 / DSM 11109 / ASRB2) TaxID=880072 RepID=F2NGQ1_DESAR|nr:histone family protein DNA-binding protein [Desulfobacca acetoxidans DSM 11109]
MTKADLISAMAAQANLTKAETEKTLNALITVMTSSLQTDGKLSIPGLGVFSVNERAERTGRNPRTGEPMQIAASKMVKFKPGKALKEAVR